MPAPCLGVSRRLARAAARRWGGGAGKSQRDAQNPAARVWVRQKQMFCETAGQGAGPAQQCGTLGSTACGTEIEQGTGSAWH